jgi:hypothetical protein
LIANSVPDCFLEVKERGEKSREEFKFYYASTIPGQVGCLIHTASIDGITKPTGGLASML